MSHRLQLSGLLIKGEMGQGSVLYILYFELQDASFSYLYYIILVPFTYSIAMSQRRIRTQTDRDGPTGDLNQDLTITVVCMRFNGLVNIFSHALTELALLPVY